MAETRPAALFFTPEAPYPLVGGGSLRAASLLHYLARRYDVDVLVFRQPGAADPRAAIPPGLVREIRVLDLPVNSRAAAARTLRTADRLARGVPPLFDRFRGFEAAVADGVAACRYDVGVVEHFWLAQYAGPLRPRCGRLVLDLHNVESALHACCAGAEGGIAGAAHRVFARASERLEREWLPRFDVLLAASHEDAGRVREIAPRSRVAVYPNALPAVPPPERRDENVLAFSGNMEYHPNIGAVRYFRREIWPRLRDRWPGLVWRLVGKNPGAVRRYTAGDDRIEVRGAVEDAVAELARARVAVAPLLAGSGTRFKILEAWAAGVPVVSTSLGAEGLGVHAGEHALLADTPEAFVQEVSRLLGSPELRRAIAGNGRALLLRDFTWEAAWKLLEFQI